MNIIVDVTYIISGVYTNVHVSMQKVWRRILHQYSFIMAWQNAGQTPKQKRRYS